MANKSKQNTSPLQKAKDTASHMDRDDVAKVAAGVALAAGAVAVGIELSDKKNRQKIAKGAKNAAGQIRELAATAAEEAPKAYAAVSSQISAPHGKGQGQKSSQGKKTASK